MSNSRERWTGWAGCCQKSVLSLGESAGRARLFARDDETCLPDVFRRPRVINLIPRDQRNKILAGRSHGLTSKILPTTTTNHQPALATAPASQPIRYIPMCSLCESCSFAHRIGRDKGRNHRWPINHCVFLYYARKSGRCVNSSRNIDVSRKKINIELEKVNKLCVRNI